MSETIDPRNNPESQVAEDAASQTGTQSTSGGPVHADFPEAGQTPAQKDAEAGTPAGTGQGNPLAGVLISDEDKEDAVSGDTGPEHRGARRDSTTGGPA